MWTKTLFVASFMAVAACAAPATAVASIPFEFEAGGKVMPAGRYLVTEGLHKNVLQLVAPDGRSLMFATSDLGDPNAMQSSRLVFERGVRGRYEMAEVWMSSMPTGKALVRKRTSSGGLKTAAASKSGGVADGAVIVMLTN